MESKSYVIPRPVHIIQDDNQYSDYIDCSSVYVRFVMAFNIEYSEDRLKPHPNITISTWQLTTEGDTWFPEKCLNTYNVRTNANHEESETNIGLNLSHLHKSLEEYDIPIKLPLRKLVSLVEESYQELATRDTVEYSIKRTRRYPSPPKSLKGKKRARTDVLTATADDESNLLRDPDASYRPSSAKRIKTKGSEQAA